MFDEISEQFSHIYILLSEGKIQKGVCADVNEGPLLKARENALLHGVKDSLSFILTDGALALSGLGITDYAICGMGGELIRDIISRAPNLKSHGVRLVLQPMSRQATLRRFLFKEGFATVGEDYSFEAGKYYLTLAVEYTGVSREISDFEAEFGALSKNEKLSSAKRGYITSKINSLKKAAVGKSAASPSNSFEAELLKEFYEIMGDDAI